MGSKLRGKQLRTHALHDGPYMMGQPIPKDNEREVLSCSVSFAFPSLPFLSLPFHTFPLFFLSFSFSFPSPFLLLSFSFPSPTTMPRMTTSFELSPWMWRVVAVCRMLFNMPFSVRGMYYFIGHDLGCVPRYTRSP